MSNDVVRNIAGYGGSDGERTHTFCAATIGMWIERRVSCQVPFQHIPAPVSRCSNDQISCMPTQIAVKITLG